LQRRAVVVGAGAISTSWFPALLAENVDIAAVVDLRREAAQARIGEYGLEAQPSTDLQAALGSCRPDFVVDLTVPEAHCGVTCTALRAGCHVIGEKPMSSTMDEARQMVRTADETGRMYMVSQSRRWEPKHDRARLAVAQGVIGALTTLNCDFYVGAHFGGFRDEMPSPLILDMAIHHFDLARFIGGVDPVAVYAKESSPAGSWYDGAAAASCIFEMTDGVIFTYRGSWCAEGLPTSCNGDWRVIGSRGTLLYERDGDPRAETPAGDDGFIRPVEQAAVPPSPMASTGMHGALKELLAFLDGGDPPQTECHDNIKSLAMVFGAIESARLGERVPVSS
jgi:predicted dehydrogenase